MNIRDINITPNPLNPVDYNIKCNVFDDADNVIADFSENGINVFEWWANQDEDFRLNIVNQFMWIMAREIVAGTAE